MLTSILVGLDGSDDCLPAVELGIAWAKRFDCLLVGIGVVDEPAIRGYQEEKNISPSYRAAYEQLLTTARHNVEQALERFVIQCGEEQVASKLLEVEGEPCESILTELQRYDLLILGRKTHFRHGSEKHPCQTFEHVLRNSPRPIIAVSQPPHSTNGENVVVAYDGSVQAGRALQTLLATGLNALGPVHVVSVHCNSSLEAARTADHAIEFLRFRGIQATPIPLVSDTPANTFLDYAHEINAGLIVMGAYGQPKVKEFFFGSATCTALEKSTVPLFLYH